ncbi:transglutaminase domain-containing protein [Streptomyces sp. NPDC088915]|uniref:transglutaminase domain-containing protein n=1 Tax=Streptomyces sp. NPDC088915 TaxID=3365912 RepID=UPI00383034CA
MAIEDRIRLFERVRAIPYATDGAHDAASLLTEGRGDCVAKADYLVTHLPNIGVPARRVRWLYHLPPEPAEVNLLISREDVHTAVEAQVDGRWVLVDATHDPALGAIGLTVAEWDGHTATTPAYEPVGPLWRPGDPIPEPVPNRNSTRPFDPAAGRVYRAAFNRWLRDARG